MKIHWINVQNNWNRMLIRSRCTLDRLIANAVHICSQFCSQSSTMCGVKRQKERDRKRQRDKEKKTLKFKKQWFEIHSIIWFGPHARGFLNYSHLMAFEVNHYGIQCNATKSASISSISHKYVIRYSIFQQTSVIAIADMCDYSWWNCCYLS